jgi:hypothetical protein
MRIQLKDSPNGRIVTSETYNYIFNKKSGFFARWGRTQEDDPQYSPIGPEIDNCPDCCTFCSPAGTSVQTPNGNKEIQDLRCGDSVCGFDINRGEIVTQNISDIYQRDYKGELISVELESNEILLLTPGHLVYTNAGWIQAKDLTEDLEITHFNTHEKGNVEMHNLPKLSEEKITNK